MPLIRKISNRGKHTLVGVAIPQQVNEYITLYTLAKGTTKSKVLREKIEQFISLQRTKQSDDDLLIELIDRIRIQWKLKKATEEITLEEFKTILKAELIKKGLSEKHLEIILKELE